MNGLARIQRRSWLAAGWIGAFALALASVVMVATQPAQAAEVSLSVTDGQVVSGNTTISAEGSGGLAISVDGEPKPVQPAFVTPPVLVFEVDGYAGGQGYHNSVWVNGTLVDEPAVNINGYSPPIEVSVPTDLLVAGENTFRLRAGNLESPTSVEGNHDDWFVRDVRLRMPDGSELRDPDWAPEDIIKVGDGPTEDELWEDFGITIPAERMSGVFTVWDTTTVADGEHLVEATATAADGTTARSSATVVVDNTAPTIDVRSPQPGQLYKGGLPIDVSATDAIAGVRSTMITVDGDPVTDGQTLSTDDLADGEHTLTVTATDERDNVGETTVVFSTVRQRPDAPSNPAPADDATGVRLAPADLGVTVSDPAGDPLDVSLRWAYRADFADSTGIRATHGFSTQATPASGDGQELNAAGYSAVAAADDVYASTRSTDGYPYQRFELAAPADLQAEQLEVVWEGTAPRGRQISLSVWDHATQRWTPVAHGDGGTNVALHASVPVSTAVHDGAVQVLVQDVSTPIADGNPVFAWMTDTQYYSEREPATYRAINQWILDHRESEGIGYTIHTGDIVQNPLVQAEWERADQIMQMLDDANMPYGVVPGNHDIGPGKDYGLYRTYFGEDRFAHRPWYGGTYGDNIQHYDLLSTPKADFLMLYLDWRPGSAEIAWANRVIASHPDHNVIIGIHDYLVPGGDFSGSGELVFDQVVVPNPNVDLVLAGHNPGVAYNVKHLGDRTIVEVMGDYQNVPTAGGGFFRLLTYDVANDRFTNRTLSAISDATWAYDDALENFATPLDIDPAPRQVSTDYVTAVVRTTREIGTRADVPSGDRVTFSTGRLERATRYSWYATVADEYGTTATSQVWDFSTAGWQEATARRLSRSGG